MRVGRNDPCPCGSGRKYKKCCLAADSMTAPYSAADREAALEGLRRVRGRASLEVERSVAAAEFRRPLESTIGETSGGEGLAADISEAAFDDWFMLDRKGPDGLTPVEAYLRREGDRLMPGEREFIARMGRTELRLYEVGNPPAGAGASNRGAGVELIDRWSAEQWSVPQPPPGAGLGSGALLAARVMPGPAGAPVIEGALLTFPDRPADEVLALLRQAWRRQEPEAPDEPIFKSAAPILHAVWAQTLPRLPSPDPDDDDEFPTCVHVVFDVLDRRALDAALAAHADLVDDGYGGYTWRGTPAEPTRGVTNVEIDGEKLVLHLPSASLVQRARRMIEDVAGAAVRHAWSDRDDEEEQTPSDAPMEPRQVAVDWASLERAFESSAAEANCYLDLRTGETYIVPVGSSQDGAGGLTEDELDDAYADGHLLLVEPLGPLAEHEWMREFAATVAEGRLRERLDAALDGHDALRGFIDALAPHADALARWRAVRRERLGTAMRSWLDDNAVVPTTPRPEGPTGVVPGSPGGR